jgi:hypothetical protein
MPDAYAIPHFLSGEWSQFAQGRFDRRDYRMALQVCFNMFPEEVGALVRRPGTMFAGATRGGAPGRVIKYDFDQEVPVSVELTDGWLRFGNVSRLTPKLLAPPTALPVGPPSLTIVNAPQKRGGKYG